ncbi:MAG: leucine-rich repeat domain-containing protein [Lentisphaeria bacterium]|nr:leucine-rich repeat domain-containing protein [Lentisphaeria bacterium]NQZ66544.1 leucine-rich repeat domain-containing protein [Lentisphaeria bacterium]
MKYIYLYIFLIVSICASQDDPLVHFIIEDLNRLLEQDIKIASGSEVDDLLVYKNGLRLKHPWDADGYTVLYQKNLKKKPQSKKDNEALRFALLNLSGLTIEKQNSLISKALSADRFQASTHADAALLIGALILKESSGTFYDIRKSLCRMTSHLAAARMLEPETNFLNAELARIILLSHIGHGKKAFEKLKLMPQNGLNLIWKRSLLVDITGDWRQAKDNKYLLEQIIYARKMLQYSDGAFTKKFMKKYAKHSEFKHFPDWYHILMLDPKSRIKVLPYVQQYLLLDSAEIQTVFNEKYKRNFLSAKLIVILNVKSSYCIDPGRQKNKIEVIDWGTWAEYFQRHLAQLFSYMRYHQTYSRYSELTQYPFIAINYRYVNLHHSRYFVHEAIRNWGNNKFQINEFQQNYLQQNLRRDRKNVMNPMTSYLVSPYHFKFADLSRRNFLDLTITAQNKPPFGTSYQCEVFLTNTPLKTVEKWYEANPYNSVLALHLVKKQKYPNYKMMDKICGKKIDYNIQLVNELLKISEENPFDYHSLLDRIIPVYSDMYLEKYLYSARTGDLQMAISNYKSAAKERASSKKLVICSKGVIDYYLRNNELNKALSTAQSVKTIAPVLGDLYLAEIYEQAKNFAEAEKIYINLRKKFKSSNELLAFYVRLGRLWNNHQKDLNAYTLIKNIFNNPAFDETDLARTQKVSRQLLFPGGIQKVKENKRSATLIISAVKGLNNVKAGDILAGINGLDISDIYQYFYLNIHAPDPFSLSILRDGKLTTLKILKAEWGKKVKVKQVFKLENEFLTYEEKSHSLKIENTVNQDQFDKSVASFKETGNLKNLLSLTIKNCALDKVPDFVFAHKQLKKLNLSFNNIKILDPRIKELSELKYLNLTSNALSKFPTLLSSMKSLETVIITHNKITELKLSAESSIKKLSLAANFLSAISLENENLEQLILHNNLITKLDIKKSTGLKNLNLANNLLKTFEYGQFKQLRKLDLSSNYLSSVDDSIGSLTQLQKLSLAGNNLRSLNLYLVKCSTLKQLNISKNRIGKLSMDEANMFLVFPVLKKVFYGANSSELHESIKKIRPLLNQKTFFYNEAR